MLLEAGRVLAHYQLVHKIGEGGMGVVWKATDTRLGREVAVKILPDIFSGDTERLARFEREARLLASLNHRNIAAIHDFEEADGMRFLVMELIEGEDLERRLARGPLPMEEALDIARQLAHALEAAHDKSILHRDLKPANVLVTEEGLVKVLDFGLAKAMETDPEPADPRLSPTLTSAGTAAGLILGTAAYMSPEQARGKPLTKRTDIWSFGCVLFEMLTATPPFRGETVSDLMASILTSDPNWKLLPETTPPRIGELLQRCLERDPKNRLRDIGDARIELQRALDSRESPARTDLAAPAAARGWGPGRRWAVVLTLTAFAGMALGLGLAVSLAGFGSKSTHGSGVTARVSIALPPGIVVGYNGYLLSPGGELITFSGRPRDAADPESAVWRLYTRRLDSYDIREVAGTENGVRGVRFSPDGRSLLFLAPIAPRASKSRLYRVPVDGSAPPFAVADWDEAWGLASFQWLPDGDIVIVGEAPHSLVRIPAGGGSPSAPVAIDFDGREGQFSMGRSHSSLLPDGQRVLGELAAWEERGFEINVALLDLRTGKCRVLIENGGHAQRSPTGHLLFSRGDALLAVPFDERRGETTGPPMSIAAGLRTAEIWSDAYFSLASNGTLLHMAGGPIGGDRQLVIFDERYENSEPWSSDRRAFEAGLTVSQDGRRLAVGIVNDKGLYDVWASDFAPPGLFPLVREAGQDCVPQLWTPEADGVLVLCGSARGSHLLLHGWDASEPSRTVMVTQANEVYAPTSFLPGGSMIAASHITGGKSDIVLLPLRPQSDAHSSPPQLLLSDASNGTVSPDGRFIAYVSDVSGRAELYIGQLSPGGSVGRRFPVSRSGGATPRWLSPGKDGALELRFFSGFDVFSVKLMDGGQVSEPRRIANISSFAARVNAAAVLPDRRPFLILRNENEETPGELSAVINFFPELEARARGVR